MSNRAFGVEIECYAPEEVIHSCNCEYCEFEFDYYDSSGPVSDFLAANGFGEWGRLTGTDESLSTRGVEIRSPILQMKEGFAELRRLLTLLNKSGFTVDDSCGFHVHHNAPEFTDNTELIRRLVESWRDNQELIDMMVHPRRVNNDHCPHWQQGDMDELYEALNSFESYSTLRGSINVNPLHDNGSIEIRQHEGTLDYLEASSWIRFGQAFIDSIVSNPVEPMTNEELLMKRIKVQKNASRFISNKVNRNKNVRN